MSEQTTFKTSLYEETRVSESDLDPAIPDLPLVTFDLNLKTLQSFLMQLASAVNKNSLQIKLIQEELSSKVTLPQITSLVEKVSSVMPGEVQISPISTFEDLVSTLTLGTEKMFDKIRDLEHFKEKTELEIEELNEELNKKLDKNQHEADFKDLNEKISKKLDEDKFRVKWKKMKTNFQSNSINVNSKFNDYDKKIAEIKTEVLWKINDIDRLLQTRVNEQFVWDALEVLETKIKKQRDIQSSLKLSRQQSLFEKFSSELKSTELKLSHKVEQAATAVEDVEKQIIQKVSKETHEFSLKKLFQEFKSQIDPHEVQLKVSQEKIEALHNSMQELIPKVPESISENFETITSKISDISSKLETKVEKDLMLHVISNLKQPKPQIIQSPANDLNDFWKFRETTIKNFEKSDEKFDRIMKALDLNIFKRVLAGKANENSTKEEFLTVGQRLMNLERNQGEIMRELERLNAHIRRIFAMIEEMGSQSGFALISKKSLSGNCLSCGKGENSIVPTIPHVQGFDGRFYKADINSFNTYRPGMSNSDWKQEEVESRSKSPINRLPRAGLNSILGKDLITSLSTNAINRPSSAKK